MQNEKKACMLKDSKESCEGGLPVDLQIFEYVHLNHDNIFHLHKMLVSTTHYTAKAQRLT